ncbi:MAG: sodium/proton-translocating pyrophosphatase, partial [Treponema sp.]|nr:sodium/proton-translocating pyrophosphatase [Treponema sp.]
MTTEHLFFLAPVGATLALVFALFQARKIYKFSEGNDVMKRIAQSVRKGANAYLKRQYTGVAMFFIVMFVVLNIMAFAKLLTPFVPFAFITGGFFSGLSGFIGMKIATAANSRTAQA